MIQVPPTPEVKQKLKTEKKILTLQMLSLPFCACDE